MTLEPSTQGPVSDFGRIRASSQTGGAFLSQSVAAWCYCNPGAGMSMPRPCHVEQPRLLPRLSYRELALLSILDPSPWSKVTAPRLKSSRPKTLDALQAAPATLASFSLVARSPQDQDLPDRDHRASACYPSPPHQTQRPNTASITIGATSPPIIRPAIDGLLSQSHLAIPPAMSLQTRHPHHRSLSIKLKSPNPVAESGGNGIQLPLK